MPRNLFTSMVCLIVLSFVFVSVSASPDTQNVDLTPAIEKKEIASPPGLNFKKQFDFGSVPLYFIRNNGQTDSRAKFYANASKYTLWLTKKGLLFDSSGTDRDESKRDVSSLEFVNANPGPEIVAEDVSKTKITYFLGNDASKWRGNVPTSKAVKYNALYKGIDLKVYGIEKKIEYDWIVKPGANPSDIAFKYKNVNGTRIDETGNLMIETSLGELVHQRPFSYQMIDGKQVPVASKFKRLGPDTYGFSLGNYNPQVELVIDPVVMAYSTYLGDNKDDEAWFITLDNNGYVYVCGWTNSHYFPVLNPLHGYKSYRNLFISKFDVSQSGSASLLYSTYLGGGRDDYPGGLEVDSNGYVYVGGWTKSYDFPMKNGYQTFKNTSYWHVFATKLDPSLGSSGLLYSTYIGGQRDDYATAMTADNSGKIYLAGKSDSYDYPMVNAYQSGRSGSPDLILSVVDTNLTGSASLLYSTYFGKSSSQNVNDIVVDGNGYAYIAGSTSSVNFPVKNEFQTDSYGLDGILAKFDISQSGAASLLYSTYFGGDSTDNCHAMTVDDNGVATLTGYTYSTDFPLLNAYQSDGPTGDAFVIQLDTTKSGSACLLFSTYIGGNSTDYGDDILKDANGDYYICGFTESSDFPVLNPYQNYQAGYDAFILKMNIPQTGTANLLFSTLLGGNGYDRAREIALDNTGNIYVAGHTESTDYPLQNEYLTDQPLRDAFLTKFSIQSTPTVATSELTAIAETSASGGGNVTSDGNSPVTARGICWSTLPTPTVSGSNTLNGSGAGIFTSSLTGLTPATTYYVRAYATNALGTAYGDEKSFTTLQIITHTLTVQSNTPSGAAITVSPVDKNGDSNGTTDFTRTYDDGTVVTLTAPAVVEDLGFAKWIVDGADVLTASVQVTMDAAHTAVAHYEPLPPTFSILASNSIQLKDHVIVHSGDIGAYDASPGPYLNAGYEVTIGQHVTVADGSVVYGDSVKMKTGASVFDIHYNNIDNNGTIRGSSVTPLTLPLDVTFPTSPTPAPGTQDYDIAKTTTLTLGPGSYGEIIVRANATLILTGGTYHIENLKLGDNNSRVLFQAASELVINNRLEPGSSATIGPEAGSGIDAGDIWIYVIGTNGGSGGPSASPKAAVIGYNNIVNANIYVPNGTIWIKSGTVVTGTITAKDVLIGSSVEISLVSE